MNISTGSCFLFFLGGMASASSAFAAECVPTVPDSELIEPGKLIMSINPTLPPLQYVDQTGEVQGMRVELGKKIAERLCLSPEYVRIEFSAMVPGLQVGRWDMINTGIFFTEDRTKIMQMIPYEQQAISISVANTSAQAITSADDLDGKVVGVEIGGFEENKARQFNEDLKARGRSGFELRTFDSFALAYQALRAGQVDAVASIDGVAKEYATRGNFLQAVSGLYPTPVALAFRSKPLAEAVAKAINEMKADGEYQKLFDEFGAKPSQGAAIVAGPDN